MTTDVPYYLADMAQKARTIHEQLLAEEYRKVALPERSATFREFRQSLQKRLTQAAKFGQTKICLIQNTLHRSPKFILRIKNYLSDRSIVIEQLTYQNIDKKPYCVSLIAKW